MQSSYNVAAGVEMECRSLRINYLEFASRKDSETWDDAHLTQLRQRRFNG